MKGLLLALAGPARAGKNTVASIVVEELGKRGQVVKAEGFADRLKVSAARALGLEGSDAQLIATMDALKVCGSVTTSIEHGQYDLQEVHVSGREYLQLYGTEAHRDIFGEDFWGAATLPDPTAPFFGRSDRFDLLVITDLRFENETERVKACGGSVWRVTRPGVGGEVTHSSEVPIPDELVDVELTNDGDLEELRLVVRHLLDRVEVGGCHEFPLPGEVAPELRRVFDEAEPFDGGYQ